MSNFKAEKILQALKQEPRYRNLELNNTGAPIWLSVTVRQEFSTGGAASLKTSLIVTMATLGLMPVVTNYDLVIDYDIMLHKTVLASFSYRKHFTDSDSIYSDADLFDLEKEHLAWTLTTVDSFLADQANSSALNALLAEYRYYFVD